MEGSARRRRGPRPALVRGERASWWLIRGDHLILRHPNGVNTTEIPVGHLADLEMVEQHASRLRAKNWVAEAAVLEFLEIARGAAR